MNHKRNWTGWILITAIVIISGAALAVSTLSDSAAPTPEPHPHEEVIRSFFPNAGAFPDDFERLDTDETGFVYAVKQEGGIIGYAVQQTTQGYGGPIELIVAFQPDYTLGGIHVGGEAFNETENLGGKARDEAFTGQFKGAHLPVKLGENIDSISGATVTSQAVVDGVNAAAERLYTIPGLIQPAQPKRTANASVIGYGGPVLARVTLDEGGAIEALDIGGARFQETEGVGSRVRESAFTEAFIGKKAPFQLGEDIDALSGATVSSQAAVDAVNAAFEFLTSSDTN